VRSTSSRHGRAINRMVQENGARSLVLEAAGQRLHNMQLAATAVSDLGRFRRVLRSKRSRVRVAPGPCKSSASMTLRIAPREQTCYGVFRTSVSICWRPSTNAGNSSRPPRSSRFPNTYCWRISLSWGQSGPTRCEVRCGSWVAGVRPDRDDAAIERHIVQLETEHFRPAPAGEEECRDQRVDELGADRQPRGRAGERVTPLHTERNPGPVRDCDWPLTVGKLASRTCPVAWMPPAPWIPNLVRSAGVKTRRGRSGPSGNETPTVHAVGACGARPERVRLVASRSGRVRLVRCQGDVRLSSDHEDLPIDRPRAG
jgi:hypothetical protein